MDLMCRKLPLRRRSMNTIGTSYRVGVHRRQDCRKHHGAFFYAAAVFSEDAATISGKTATTPGDFSAPVVVRRCLPEVMTQSKCT